MINCSQTRLINVTKHGPGGWSPDDDDHERPCVHSDIRFLDKGTWWTQGGEWILLPFTLNFIVLLRVGEEQLWILSILWVLSVSLLLWHLNGFCHQPNYIFSTLLYIIQRKSFQSPNHGVLLHAVENPGLVFTPSPNHNSIVCSWLSSTAVHPTIWLTRKTIIVWNIGNYL